MSEKETLPSQLDSSLGVMRSMITHVNAQISVYSSLLRDLTDLRDTLVKITDEDYAENVRKFESIRRTVAPNMPVSNPVTDTNFYPSTGDT